MLCHKDNYMSTYNLRFITAAVHYKQEHTENADLRQGSLLYPDCPDSQFAIGVTPNIE